jgi:hypothetical protein
MLLVMIVLLCSSIPATAGDYLQSAHGDGTDGVDRTGMPAAYTTGNCAHCHEQHASVEGSDGSAHAYAIFSTNFSGKPESPYTVADNVCFQCHTASSSAQSGGVLLNHDYAETFGGYDEGTDEGILEQFNLASGMQNSYHNLEDIQNYAASNFSWFKSGSNPCVACHNPHRARRNKSDVDNPNLTAISRPTEHESLWGDAEGETMAAYTSYQAPYYYNSTFFYEPGGLTISDPTKVPDYSTFCNDCHDVNMPTITSTQLGRDLLMLNWSSTGTDSDPYGDKHGRVARSDPTWLREPYLSANKSNYVLSCLDCHEPHGSPYPFLMRRSINGQPLNLTDHSMDADGRGFQCLQCHKDDSKIGSGGINDWKLQHHGLGTDSPYSGKKNPAPSGGTLDSCDCHGAFEGDDGKAGGTPGIRCEICHHHGSYVPNPTGEWPATVTPKNGARKTF